VALLPETDPSGAYVVAEKIRQGASELMVEGDGQRIMTSLSIGVVSYPDDGQTADELMIAADEAMYLSKRLGGNRVVGYADPGDMPAPAISPPDLRPLPSEERETHVGA
jgi:diguanylate cyclase (GGDEF)-like protein